MSNTTPWFADREKTGILTVGSFVASFATFSLALLLSRDQNIGFAAQIIKIILLILCVAFGIYFFVRETEVAYLKSIQKDPRKWLLSNNPIEKAVSTLEKRPLKDVRKFRYGLSSHIPSLVADLGENRVVPAYLEIVQYGLQREHPHLSPVECREQAMDEYRFLYKA